MHSRILVRDADFRSVIFFRTRTCIDPFKESARFLAAEICFGLFARSRSTLHGISQKPLTFRSRSAGFDCRSETGRALRTHYFCSLGYFEVTRSYQSLRWFNGAASNRATHQTDHRRLARSTFAHFPRTW